MQNPGFGRSYRLVRASDGKPLKNLISSSRIRRYTATKRDHFYAKYPQLLTSVTRDREPFNGSVELTGVQTPVQVPQKYRGNNNGK